MENLHVINSRERERNVWGQMGSVVRYLLSKILQIRRKTLICQTFRIS